MATLNPSRCFVCKASNGLKDGKFEGPFECPDDAVNYAECNFSKGQNYLIYFVEALPIPAINLRDLLKNYINDDRFNEASRLGAKEFYKSALCDPVLEADAVNLEKRIRQHFPMLQTSDIFVIDFTQPRWYLQTSKSLFQRLFGVK